VVHRPLAHRLGVRRALISVRVAPSGFVRRGRTTLMLSVIIHIMEFLYIYFVYDAPILLLLGLSAYFRVKKKPQLFWVVLGLAFVAQITVLLCRAMPPVMSAGYVLVFVFAAFLVNFAADAVVERRGLK
jgi:hypothetical protein